MRAGPRHIEAPVSHGFAAHLVRTDDAYREQLRRRDAAFRRALVRHHRDIAERIARKNWARFVKPVPTSGAEIAIVDEIAALHGLKPRDLLGPRRKAPIVAARFHAIFEIKRRHDLSIRRMAKVFNRDRATILHAIRHWPEVRERADVKAMLEAAE